jgi:hypothetical protein
MSKVVDLRALVARKTLLLCEVGVTGSAKSRLFATRCVIHPAGSIGWGLAFPRRGDRTGGYHVFTDVRGFDVLECLGVWTSDGGAIADRLPRGSARLTESYGRPNCPRTSSRFHYLLLFSSLPFVSAQTLAACIVAFFLRVQPFPHIGFEYQLFAVSTFRRLVWCVHPILTSILSSNAPLGSAF